MFSSALLTPGWLLHAQAPSISSAGDGLHFLAMGDFGSGNADQQAVANQMARFARQLGAPLTAVLALGDNFYQKLDTARFTPHFEQMYSPTDLNVPFYAIGGNHDYGPDYDSKQGPAKLQIELDYARNNPTSRWKMPAKWYTMEYPHAANPLVRIIFLDGSYFLGALTPQEKLDQQRFLDAELARKTAATWTWVVAHYPLFSNSLHGDDPVLIKEWGPQIAAHPISLYICGHDHCLQHLQVEGYPCSFVVSGGGGARLYDIKRQGRGYAEKILGFNHIQVTANWVDVRYIDSTGKQIHAFRRTPDGKVTV